MPHIYVPFTHCHLITCHPVICHLYLTYLPHMYLFAIYLFHIFSTYVLICHLLTCHLFIYPFLLKFLFPLFQNLFSRHFFFFRGLQSYKEIKGAHFKPETRKTKFVLNFPHNSPTRAIMISSYPFPLPCCYNAFWWRMPHTQNKDLIGLFFSRGGEGIWLVIKKDEQWTKMDTIGRMNIFVPPE